MEEIEVDEYVLQELGELIDENGNIEEDDHEYA